jgi:hypothetical protein
MALAVVGAVLGLRSVGTHQTGDKLLWTGDGPGVGSQTIEAGEPFSAGIAVQNRGSKPLTLEEAWLEKRQPGIKILGVYTTRYPGMHNAWHNLGYTPRVGRALRGRVVPPHGGVNITFGVATLLPGKFAFQGIGLKYKVGSQTYTQRFHDTSYRLCAPAERYTLCPTVAEEPVKNWVSNS